MDYLDTSSEECKNICKLIGSVYIEPSRIDGRGITKIVDTKLFDLYKDLLVYTIVSGPDHDHFIKILKHRSDIFYIIRDDKINKILS